MLLDYKILEGQSIYDVCLMLYGKLDFLFKLLGDNNLSISDKDIRGTIVTYDNTYGNDYKKYLQRSGNIKYVTNITPSGGKITEEDILKITEDGYIKIME